jgi:predicted protein tyrosine phosphatase
VVSLLDPDITEAEAPRIAGATHHVFRLFDQERAEAPGHFDAIMAEIIALLEPVGAGPCAKIVVHCHAGVSRSTAVAYGLLALSEGRGREPEAFDALLTITRKPWPNRRVVEAIDRVLCRSGALLAPLDAYRARHPRRIDAWHCYNAGRGLPERVKR